jgi:CBS domain-containing protein
MSIPIETTTVHEWMSKSIVSVSPVTSIGSAHQIMIEHGIRRLPVVEHNKLVGMITIGDVREASPSDASSLSIWEMNFLWGRLTVDEIMTRKVITVKADQLLVEAARLMLEKKISGLPVVDQDDHMIGILTESDIFRMLVTSFSTVTS